MKKLFVVLLCAVSTQAQNYTMTLTTQPWNQDSQSPTYGPLNPGGEMSAKCSHTIPGTKYNPPKQIINNINTGTWGSHVIAIGVILPGGGRGPCHVPVTFDAHGSAAVRYTSEGYSYPGVQSGVFTMSWTYNAIYYQVTNYLFLYCDNFQDGASGAFTYPC